MPSANEGAYKVNPNKSIGMGISLPFEPSLNPYVTPELAFEYHYFFTRKFWMVLQAMALVVAPGGVGTMDEVKACITSSLPIATVDLTRSSRCSSLRS